MLTEIKVEGVGIMRHLNDWQVLRIRRMPTAAQRDVAMVAFGLGMTVQQFKSLSAELQGAAWAAFDKLTSPAAVAPPEAPSRPRLPQKGEHVSIERQAAIGRDLIGIKSKLPHGHFRVWVEDKSGISYSQAQRFMKAAKEAGEMEAGQAVAA